MRFRFVRVLCDLPNATTPASDRLRSYHSSGDLFSSLADFVEAAVVLIFSTRLVVPKPEATWAGVNAHVLNGGMPAPEHDNITLAGKTLPFPRGTASRL